VPRRAPEGEARLLPRPGLTSAARAGRKADAGLRRDARVRARVARRGPPAPEFGEAALAGRKPRRRRDADLPPGDDDPCVGAGGETPRARDQRRPGANLRRPRRRRRSRGRPDASSQSGVSTLVDFLLHADKKLLELVAQYGSWVYGILFAIVFAETGFVVTPFLPGDSLLFATGALCAQGRLSTP